MRKIGTILNGLTLVTVIGFLAVLTVVMVGIAVLHQDAAIDAQTYKVEEAVANPVAFQNRPVCLKGYYQTSWKISDIGKTFMGEALDVSDSNDLVQRVWVNVPVPEDDLVCVTQNSIQTCGGETIACGKFVIDERGLGYNGQYRYGLY